MAAQAGVPALGGWVYDSDFAYLVGADPEGTSFELLLGEPYETDGDPEYARELEALASTEGRRRSAQALSAWSKTNATSPVAVDAVLKILEAQSVFVEEGLAELFTQLGLPDAGTILNRL